jgi:hypothetical protein
MDETALQEKYVKIMPYFNEKQKRLFVATEAIALGYGGVSTVSRLTGISRTTIKKGQEELDTPQIDINKIRKEGSGPTAIHRENKQLISKIENILDESTRGDPMSPLKWTCKSTRQMAVSLSNKNYSISHMTVNRILKQLDYSLQSNEKSLSSKNHPDRDEQFKYINKLVKRFIRKGMPVISVDTKKKEYLGNTINKGQEWCPKQTPRKVDDHDFPNKENGIAIPYGVYGIGGNSGWVNVGTDNDTSSFAVNSIGRWWNYVGRKVYPDATKLLICADGGGSNGYRVRLWKYELQKLANKLGVEITICHFPPGTSKWNKVEHRLFSHISMNWKGQPLTSHDVVVKMISSTKTKTGLKVKAKIDRRTYPKGRKVSKEEIANINLVKHKFHGEWNYTIRA